MSDDESVVSYSIRDIYPNRNGKMASRAHWPPKGMVKIAPHLIHKLPPNSRIGYIYQPENKDPLYFPSAFFRGIVGTNMRVQSTRIVTLPLSRVRDIYFDQEWHRKGRTGSAPPSSRIERKLDELIALIKKPAPTSNQRVDSSNPRRPKSGTHAAPSRAGPVKRAKSVTH